MNHSHGSLVFIYALCTLLCFLALPKEFQRVGPPLRRDQLASLLTTSATKIAITDQLKQMKIQIPKEATRESLAQLLEVHSSLRCFERFSNCEL